MNAPVPKHESHGSDHAGHGTVTSYVIGFVLSVVLTAIPFVLVMHHMLPAQTAILAVVGIGVVQILVHLFFFLHMNTSSGQLWNNTAFIFTVVVVGILVVGSLWIMYHLNMNMMPGMMPTE